MLFFLGVSIKVEIPSKNHGRLCCVEGLNYSVQGLITYKHNTNMWKFTHPNTIPAMECKFHLVTKEKNLFFPECLFTDYISATDRWIPQQIETKRLWWPFSTDWIESYSMGCHNIQHLLLWFTFLYKHSIPNCYVLFII